MCKNTSSGRLSQLLHFGPLITIFLVVYIAYCGYICIIKIWPSPTSSPIHMAIYLSWPLIIFYNYFNTVFLGPGFVPKNWKPERKIDESKLQFCKICDGFKAPRSHHCRKCKRCVLKMDHHCPWINTCCGHRNHASFVYFLCSAIFGCSHAFVIIAICIYRAMFRNLYTFYHHSKEHLIHLTFLELVLCMFAAGMAIGVTIALLILLVVQLKSIVKNQTGIESWIMAKAEHIRKYNKIDEVFIYPYNLGYKENIRQVFNWTGLCFRPIGNGIWWNVNKNCDQFTLTVEQLLQKKEKRVHSVQYRVVRNYSGSFFPCGLGCGVFCCLPWTEEPRIVLFENDLIHVTRWQKYWLYGEIKDSDEQKTKRQISKGWFPKKCAILNDTLDEFAAATSDLIIEKKTE